MRFFWKISLFLLACVSAIVLIWFPVRIAAQGLVSIDTENVLCQRLYACNSEKYNEAGHSVYCKDAA